VLVGLAAAVVLVLVIAQLVLPGIAVERVRERVGRYGKVYSVHVHADPAIQLVWGSAEEIAVEAGPLRMSSDQLADLERQLDGVDRATLATPRLNLTSSSTAAGQLPLLEARLDKRGDALSASGVVRASALQVTLPAGLHVDGLAAESGRPAVALSGEAFGVHVSGHALVVAREGTIVVEPSGLPFGGIASITLFSDPRIYVETLTATPYGEAAIRINLRARPAS
jgi:hypothetical protein